MATCAEDGCDKTAVDGDMYCVDDLEPEFRRDELLRQIGERVVGRVTNEAGIYQCPSCGQHESVEHTDDCPLSAYLEATDD